MRSLLTAIALVVVAALAACGGDDEPAPDPSASTTAETGCGEIEEVEVPLVGQHEEREFTVDDYETNPPAGGDHNPVPLAGGSFYDDPPDLGQSVHLLEHGAVIGWTNGLAAEDLEAVQDEFNRLFKDGYYQLATIENPAMEVPFALSAWGAVQTCAEADVASIAPFVEEWYASPKSSESALACQGQARSLPAC